MECPCPTTWMGRSFNPGEFFDAENNQPTYPKDDIVLTKIDHV